MQFSEVLLNRNFSNIYLVLENGFFISQNFRNMKIKLMKLNLIDEINCAKHYEFFNLN